MRLTTPLLTEVRDAPAQSRGFEPKTSLVSLAARVFGDTPETAVDATFSVFGQVKEPDGQRPYKPVAIPFSGATIISFSGTGDAQWEGQIEGNGYDIITMSLSAMSTLTSLQSAATEAEL